MLDQKPIPVPPPSTMRFENGIAHPDLWLWDSWTAEQDGTLHLYTLAISRTDASGAPTLPENRNDYPFHIRHFTSRDAGVSWRDEGAFLTPGNTGDGAFARNVWSGCMLARRGGDWLCGFTGIREQGPERPFLQTICIGESSDGEALDEVPDEALSCPVRDYDLITASGYYLPHRETLGAAGGEEGGPILAWRDPFIVDTGGDRLDVVWSAKTGPKRGAVAHASIVKDKGAWRLETLHPPMTLPDDEQFTQAEVPKIHHDPESGTYYLLISACDRLSETQPADEVTKVLRLYRATSIRGPWEPAFAGGSSVIPGTETLFGASIAKADFAAGRMHLIAPYSEYASETRQLTIAAPRVIDLPRSGYLPASRRQGSA